VHGAPDTIDKNEEVIKMTLAAPMAPECWLELIPWSSMAKIRFFTDYREDGNGSPPSAISSLSKVSTKPGAIQ